MCLCLVEAEVTDGARETVQSRERDRWIPGEIRSNHATETSKRTSMYAVIWN